MDSKVSITNGTSHFFSNEKTWIICNHIQFAAERATSRSLKAQTNKATSTDKAAKNSTIYQPIFTKTAPGNACPMATNP
jgi:hypothetical protein